ncbi:prohibitin family protein [Chromobacterium sp. IIBBL 290-4]|uniref:prohibitin family protein n=1 Tax=Chromobacterium sp. IIBBL 290-4 TaxID=2953890 RepID=UPI0020B72A37|nr:prohibitin family protein [Chromobacterium sp. IIBBL 290-4]UTH74607.1 prohibitin family protein [Chromobacterium sp. IIBBL 290-4]
MPMPSRGLIKIGAALLALIVLFNLMDKTLLSWTVINPGYTGIKINRLIDRGISKENVVTGFVFFNPIQSVVVVYPTFVQREVWTRSPSEGSPSNEELSFNTKDAVPVTIDVAVSYLLDARKVPEFYTRFRADDISNWTHGYLRDTARNIVVAIGSEYSFDDVNGVKKEEFLSRVAAELNRRTQPIGVSIQQFGLVGALRPPPELANAVNAKTKAIQDSIRTENEVRAAQAEARKKVAIAEGEAAANRALASSLDDRLLAWERLKLQRAYIDKWNGQMPNVVGGEGNGLLLNIPGPAASK